MVYSAESGSPFEIGGKIEEKTSVSIGSDAEFEDGEYLDLTRSGEDETIASITVSSNDPDGFSIAVEFENDGKLINEDNSDAVINGTKAKLVYNSGDLGDVTNDFGDGVEVTDLSKTIEYNTGNSTTATSDWVVDVKMDYESGEEMAAGNYKETVTVTASAN